MKSSKKSWSMSRSQRKKAIKRPFKLTSAGWVFILYTIGVGAGAINTGNNLLYLVFGVFLGLILASGFLSDLSLWGLSVEWTFPHTAEAGAPAAVFPRITNRKKWLPSLSVSVGMEGSLRGKSALYKVYVPFISAGQTVSARIEFTPESRGWFQMQNIKLYTRYPFALLEKWWRIHRDDGVRGFFVTPAIFRLDSADVPISTLNEVSVMDAEERGDGPTFYGVRTFREGDNPRRIHWKSSAKKIQELLVREMESERAFDILLRCPTPKDLKSWSGRDAEALVSFLASVICAYEAEGHKTYLLIGNGVVAFPDEFLSLWDPQKELDENTRQWVRGLHQAAFRNGMREMEGLAVFERWRGSIR